MKNVIIRTAATLALLTTTAQAFAQEFDGFYIGVQGSHNEMTQDVLPSTYAGNGDGRLYGAFAGYNHQLQNDIILGAEVAYSDGKVEHRMSPAATLLGHRLHSENYLDVKAKLGYAFDPKAMGYITGGRSLATAEHFAGTTTTVGIEGYNYGAGFDYKVSNNVSIGAEILKREFDTVPSTGSNYDGMSYALRAAWHF